jgi:hypothetical protein
MHAAQWPGAFSSSGGNDLLTRRVLRRVEAARVKDAAGRRVRRRRRVPREDDALPPAAGAGDGIAESSACVYGIVGSA